MFRKGPRVSRRLCGFRRGRPFSGSVENPSFFFFFATHSTPPKNQSNIFFAFRAPRAFDRSCSIARRSLKYSEEHTKQRRQRRQRSAAAAARGRTKGARTRRLQDHIDRAGARLVFFFFPGWRRPSAAVGWSSGRFAGFLRRVERESEGDRRGVSRSGADGPEP